MPVNAYESKCERLKKKVGGYASEDVAVAFSGGVDSSLLLKIACDAARERGTRVYGVFLYTMLHPQGELEEAEKVAREMNAIFHVLKINELEEAGIAENPADRCYRCKRYLFQRIQEEMSSFGVRWILEGTNEDDLHVYRPGIRAVRELGIISPLAEVKMTKKEVRRMAEEYGISVSKKPSVPCLATRFPYGTRISYEEMQKVGAGEAFLKTLGLFNVRLRVHGKIARIEVDRQDMTVILDKQDVVTEYLKNLGYIYITLDLEGFRSGSMDTEIR
jgi:uncharacterized protein